MVMSSAFLSHFNSGSELIRLCNLRLTDCHHMYGVDTEAENRPTTTPQQEQVYWAARNILTRYPHAIHSENKKGQNALLAVCFNPTLVNHLPLIQLLVETSEYVTECAIDSGSTGNVSLGKCSKCMQLVCSIYQHIAVNNKNAQCTEAEGSEANIDASDDGVRPQCHNMPTQARIVRSKSSVEGQTPLHMLCQNPVVSPHIIEYMIQCYPAAVCCHDASDGNSPLHYACMLAHNAASSNGVVQGPSLEIFELLIQRYPESCQIPNRDGNLPLHFIAGGEYITSDDGVGHPNVICQPKNKGYAFWKLSDVPYFKAKTQHNLSIEEKAYKNNRICPNHNHEVPESIASDDSGSEETHIGDDEDESFPEDDDNFKTNDNLCTTNKRHDINEESNTANSQRLLEIVQHLVDVNPSAMELVNRHGHTPYEIAAKMYEESVNMADENNAQTMIINLLNTYQPSFDEEMMCELDNIYLTADDIVQSKVQHDTFGRINI